MKLQAQMKNWVAYKKIVDSTWRHVSDSWSKQVQMTWITDISFGLITIDLLRFLNSRDLFLELLIAFLKWKKKLRVKPRVDGNRDFPKWGSKGANMKLLNVNHFRLIKENKQKGEIDEWVAKNCWPSCYDFRKSEAQGVENGVAY